MNGPPGAPRTSTSAATIVAKTAGACPRPAEQHPGDRERGLRVPRRDVERSDRVEVARPVERDVDRAERVAPRRGRAAAGCLALFFWPRAPAAVSKIPYALARMGGRRAPAYARRMNPSCHRDHRRRPVRACRRPHFFHALLRAPRSYPHRARRAVAPARRSRDGVRLLGAGAAPLHGARRRLGRTRPPSTSIHVASSSRCSCSRSW